MSFGLNAWIAKCLPALGYGVFAGYLGGLWGCKTLHAAPDPRWDVSSSFSYSSGDYGTDVDTTVVYVPVTLKRYFDWGSLALTAPYLAIDSSGDFVFVDGAVVSRPTTVPVSEKADGLGDLLLKARYAARKQRDHIPGIDLVGKLKLPTANEADGLGTGEADVGFVAETYYWLTHDWIAYLDAGVNFLGDPPDRDYNNQLVLNLGAGYQPAPRWWHGVYLDYHSSAVDGADDPISLLYVPSCRFGKGVSVFGVAEAGLSDGAPDYGLTVGASKRF